MDRPGHGFRRGGNPALGCGWAAPRCEALPTQCRALREPQIPVRGEGEAAGAFQVRALHPAFLDRERAATLRSDSRPVAPGAANHCPNLTASYPPTPTESSEENLPKMALG